MSERQKKYDELFGLGTPTDIAKTKRALACALDIRKFEIELYWKRAAYFWALIAAAFAAYCLLSKDITKTNASEEVTYLRFIIVCIGFIFTWAWHLVNRGSKYWQENWENHVDMLETKIMGPLYKTILFRPNKDGHESFLDQHITGPLPISVSKINQFVSVFTLFIWLLLGCQLFPNASCFTDLLTKYSLAAVMTLFFALLIRYGSKTHLGTHVHRMKVRNTEIKDADG